MKYQRLFEPMQIGKITVKNRYAMAPMGGAGQAGLYGEFSADAVEYYAERARGGVGLIFTGVSLPDTTVDVIPPGVVVCNRFSPGVFVQSASRLTEQIHAYGAKVFMQLSMGMGRNGGGVSPSDLPFFKDPSVICREITAEEIKTKIAAIIEGAAIAKATGFDGVEVHAMHEGYLLDQFAMSFMNKRTDEYGGSLENRIRPAVEILQGIKHVCGADFPVSMRLGLKTYIKGFNQASLDGEGEVGRTLEEGIEISKLLEKAGYDLLSVDSGTYDSYYWVHPPMYQPKGLNLSLSEACKKAVSIPVITAGRMDDPDMCLNAVETGKTDGVVLGRALLADPEYCDKVAAGKTEKIRPCLGCHLGCCARIFANKPMSCAVNPQVLRETTYKVYPANVKKNVLVIGGGVGGMEAARVAKLRGHEVTLVEKSGKLGGNLIPGGQPSFKGEDKELIAWYEGELKELGVTVKLNSEMNADDVIAFGADEVVLATGSIPMMPKSVKGIDSSKAISSVDALNGKRKLGETIVVAGGGLVGCELALDLAQKGKKVTVVEMMDKILSSGKPVPIMNAMMLTDLLAKEQVEVKCGYSLKEINETGAVIASSDGKEEAMAADDVVVAIGFKSVNSLAGQLLGKVKYHDIGDGKAVANVMTAVWEAYEVARNL